MRILDNKLSISVFMLILPVFASTQITVQPVQDTQHAAIAQLLRKTLVGEGVFIGNFTVKGSPDAMGLFQLNSSKDLVKEGLVLSTGHLTDIPGPNDTGSTTTIMQTLGDVDLGKHIGSRNGDAVSIEFDFIPHTDSIVFHYFFASEEYPEYVGKGFNDAFAFLIQGPGYPTKTNIAKVNIGPNKVPITIDNINFVRNPDYFITNHLPEDLKKIPKKGRKYLGDPQMLDVIAFDGLTTRLRAVAKVVPFEMYTLKIVIADVGDLRYDSGVFLEKESFSTPQVAQAFDTLKVLQQFNIAYEGNADQMADVRERFPQLREQPKQLDTLHFTLHFATDSFALNAAQKRAIADFLNKADGEMENITIKGHTDNVGSYQYNLPLSNKRAQSVAQFLRAEGIEPKRVQGYAFLQPSASNNSEESRSMNRRAEISIIVQR